MQYPQVILRRIPCILLKTTAITLGFFGLTRMPSAALAATFPRYDHIFLIIEENHGFSQVIGNAAAPNLNAFANAYGLATNYSGTSSPSEPNYVAMLGGSDFGITDDNAYYINSVDKPSIMTQLEAAGKTWKAYHQGMPYPGFRGLGFPGRTVGVPDVDPLYASKHNGMLNFKNIANSASERAKMVPLTQLTHDLAANPANFCYIVPDLTHDMHGAPTFGIDGGAPGDAQDNALVGIGDKVLGQIVNEIKSAPFWSTGNNAIVIVYDEGADGDVSGCCDANPGSGLVATIVISNHGPRGLKDSTPYNHYSLCSSLQKAFGLGCLEFTCDTAHVKPMTPLFATQ